VRRREPQSVDRFSVGEIAPRDDAKPTAGLQASSQTATKKKAARRLVKPVEPLRGERQADVGE
jgi:hypothetical protein